jgi:hypothetical protein
MRRVVSVCRSVCLSTMHSFSLQRIYTKCHTGARMYLTDVSTLTSPQFLDMGRSVFWSQGHVTYTSSFIASYYQSWRCKSVTWPSGLRPGLRHQSLRRRGFESHRCQYFFDLYIIYYTHTHMCAHSQINKTTTKS